VQHRRGHFGHLVRSRLGRNDLGTLDQLVAVAVVTVGVRVEQRANGRRGGDGRHRRQHLRRERQVEQRVDEQRHAIAHHEASIAPAPAAIRLQVREALLTQLLETLLICHVAFLPRRTAPLEQRA
jgi:hypothetical protein